MVWNPNPRLHKALVWLLGISFILVPVVATTQLFTSAPNAYAAGSPTINIQPLPQNPALGGGFSLTVSASATDGGTLSYQWYRRATTSDVAVALTDSSGKRSGTSTSSMTVVNSASNDAGLYSVVVTNTANGQTASTTSNEVSVYVGLQGESFIGSALNDPNSWIMTYTNYPECLTAATGQLNTGGTTVTTTAMSGCNLAGSSALDTAGQGALRLISNMGSQSAFALYNVARNTANGLDISFYESMWAYPGGGGQPGDGFSVFLKDGNDNISSPGYLGGALGYSAYSTSNSASPGISNALFGVGFDTYGNFTSNSYGGQDCINNAGGTTSGQYQYTSAITRSGVTTYETETYYASPNTNDNGISGGDAILIRGPQGSSQSAGYCVITPHPENPDTATIGSNTFTTRALGTHLMRITVEPSTFANPQIRVYVDGVQKTTAPAPLAYKDSPTFKFGFSGGTGRVTQNVDIWSLNINTFDGLSPPDPPSNISVTAVPNTNGGSETVTWAAPGSWGSSETGTGYRSYTAKVYDAYGTIYQGYSCTTLSTTCVISGVPAGNYTVAVTATNKANITSINSTITSAAQFLVSSLTNFTNGPCLSQATSNQFIDTFTVANYCVLRFLTPNSTNWYAPTGVNSLNYLIVGGGGAGGANRGGGGGGGGVETGTMVVSTPVHTIVVGSGGVGTSTEPTPSSSNGGSSSIDNETVLGGGAGGSGNANGLSGSSGGGGGVLYSGTPAGGSPTSNGTAQTGFTRTSLNQGFAGAAAAGTGNTSRYTGGGGGSGGAGTTGSGGSNLGIGGTAPQGGQGESVTITGTTLCFGGGGGGASGIGAGELGSYYTSTPGGSGGCNAGKGAGAADSITPSAAASGYGGGGGGGPGTGSISGSNTVGGSGGRGVVILRWIPIPTINAIPNVTAYVGRTVAFSVTDSSTLSHTYQWQQGDGSGGWTNISGATSQTLSVSAITLSMNGNVYRAMVTDTDGSISSFGYSAPALLTVSSFTTTTNDYALSFDGSSQYATVAGDPGTQISDTFTISMWVKPTARCASDCVLFSKYGVVEIKIANALPVGDGTAGDTFTAFTPAGTNVYLQTYQYRIDGNGGNGSGSPSPTWGWIDTKIPADLGMWAHIALIKSLGGATDTSTSMYVNGNLAFTGKAYNCTSGCANTVSNVNSYLTIGASFDGTNRSNYFPGQIDQVEIWNSARTGTLSQTDATTYETSTAGLRAAWDFNEGSGTIAHNMAAAADATSDLSLYSSSMWSSLESTTITNGVAVTLLPRTILTSVGGWTMPAVKSNVLIAAIGGGGGGGSDGGNGGSGGLLAYDTTTISQGTVINAVIGQGGLPNVWNSKFGKPGAGTSGGNTVISWNGAQKYSASGGNVSNVSYASGNTTNPAPTATGQTLAGGYGGANSQSTDVYAGGTGSTFYITGTSVYYLGGGGGGGCFAPSNLTKAGAAGGAGGGGGASFFNNSGVTWGQPGAANSGGGGGSGFACSDASGASTADGVVQRTPGGNGGSGAFYLRYIPALNTFTAPLSDTTTAGLTDTFTVTGSAFTGMTRTYQWQIATNASGTWSNASTFAQAIALASNSTCNATYFTSGSYVVESLTVSGGATTNCAWTPPAGVSSTAVLVVGGGGGGGVNSGSGGGGGGVSYLGSLQVSANTPVPVTIGAGGVGGTWNAVISSLGATGAGVGSSFGSLTTTGGGGGTNYSGTYVTQSGAGGTGTLGSGGAGGAGAAGSGSGSQGSNGTPSSITGISKYYGSGGGGGGWNTTSAKGGLDSGGDGSLASADGSSGVAAMGGGGGASAYHYSGGGGGSGVVLLRYSIPYGSGETTSTFTTWALTTANSGYLFRCVITDKDAIGLVATDSTTAATLTVNPAIAGSIESSTVYTTFGTANIFDTATAQYGTGALTFTLVTTPSSNGHIHFDTNTASVLIDTNTLVGTYYETLTVTDIKGATAIFYETTTVSRGVRTGFVIGGSPKANLTGILTETNTLYLSNATPIAPYYAMYDTVVATYSLVSGPSGSTCSATSSGQVYASGLSLTTCYVTVNVAQSANYLAARDTATIVFNPLISLYAVQYNAGAHQFQLANAQTPVTKQDTSTASDSSTTNTAPKISGFTVSGNDTSGVTITVYGMGFWSPLSYDTAQIDGRPLYSYFPVTISSVTTSVTPQVMVLTLPAGWCATNSVPFGTDVGPITIETPAGWAMSIADYFSQ